MKRTFILAAALAMSSAAAAQSPKPEPKPAPQAEGKPAPIQPLHVGDKAPALDIAHWVKGDKVASFEPGKIYVVEFWATWCGPCRASMPHLSETQAKYKDYGVTLISISDEKLETVQKFLKDTNKELGKSWDEVITYNLTTDPDKSSHKSYTQAVGAPGIPYAFIVGKDTKIEWAGNPHPMAPDGFDKALEAVVKDNWDREGFAKEFEAKAAKNREATAKASAAAAKFTEFKKLLAADDAKAYALGEELVKSNWDNPTALNDMAWTVVDSPDVKVRNLDFAMKAAQRANELTDQKNGAVLDTLARVHFEKGDIDKAIELQKKAIESAPAGIKPDLEAALKKYEAAKGG